METFASFWSNSMNCKWKPKEVPSLKISLSSVWLKVGGGGGNKSCLKHFDRRIWWGELPIFLLNFCFKNVQPTCENVWAPLAPHSLHWPNLLLLKAQARPALHRLRRVVYPSRWLIPAPSTPLAQGSHVTMPDLATQVPALLAMVEELTIIKKLVPSLRA